MSSARIYNAQLGRAIRCRRILLGISQEKLGERIGVTFQQVHKYEKGSNSVSFAQLVEIARALDMAPSTLILEALGNPVERGTLSDRAALELLKRIERLSNNAKRAVFLLVQNLAEDGA